MLTSAVNVNVFDYLQPRQLRAWAAGAAASLEEEEAPPLPPLLCSPQHCQMNLP